MYDSLSVQYSKKRAHLDGREEAVGDVHRAARALGVLDVDAHVAVQRDQAGDEPPRVGQVEPERRHAQRPRDLRPAKFVPDERPRLGRDIRVFREDRAHERAGEQVLVPVLGEQKARLLHRLVRRHQPVVRREQLLVADRLGEDVPEVRGAWTDLEHLRPRLGRVRGPRQDLPKAAVGGEPDGPLARVAERHLLETNTVDPVGAGDVEVP